MNPQKNIDEILNRYMTSATREDVESHCEQVFRQLQTKAEEVRADSVISHPSRRAYWPIAAAIAAVVTLAVVLPARLAQSAPAILEDANGSRKIQFGEVVRPSGNKNATLSMADGSRVEAVPQSEFLLERSEDGVTRIRLNRGAVTVVAAVAGEIRVQQGTTEMKLRAGEQVASKDRIAFEVATIRPAAAPPSRSLDGCTSEFSGYSLQIDPRRFATTRMTLLQIVALAYPAPVDGRIAFENCQLRSRLGFFSGGPEWVKTDMWDVQATIPEGLLPALSLERLSSDPKLKQMLQTLLEDRFKLVIRRETQEMPIYLLKVGKDGPRFNGKSAEVYVTSPDQDPGQVALNTLPPGTLLVTKGGGGISSTQTVDGIRVTTWHAIDVRMALLARSLTRATNRLVIDETRFKDTFSFRLEYGDGPGRPKMEKAVEQFGLKLEESKGPVEVLVIDHVEKPSEN